METRNTTWLSQLMMLLHGLVNLHYCQDFHWYDHTTINHDTPHTYKRTGNMLYSSMRVQEKKNGVIPMKIDEYRLTAVLCFSCL